MLCRASPPDMTMHETLRRTQPIARMITAPSSASIVLAAGITLTCAQAATRPLKDTRRWEVRSAGTGSKGARWYAWALVATTRPGSTTEVR